MPYCHPEQFTEEELNADFSGVQEEKEATKGSSKLWIIILCIVLALIIIGAIAGYFIYKKRNNNAEALPSTNEIEMQKIDNAEETKPVPGNTSDQSNSNSVSVLVNN